jgi:preprotein translocase subunit SecB
LIANYLVLSPADINTLRMEATSVIFPYVRSTISNLTVNANIPAYFLPTINFEPAAAPDNKGESIIIRPLEEDI